MSKHKCNSNTTSEDTSIENMRRQRCNIKEKYDQMSYSDKTSIRMTMLDKTDFKSSKNAIRSIKKIT